MRVHPQIETTWTPTKSVETTFPRKVVALQPGRRSEFDIVTFCRVLKDGSLGIPQTRYVTSWDAWVRKFAAVNSAAQPDKMEMMRAALVSARAFVKLFHDGGAAACLAEIDAALGC
jgi:hypothetical protein